MTTFSFYFHSKNIRHFILQFSFSKKSILMAVILPTSDVDCLALSCFDLTGRGKDGNSVSEETGDAFESQGEIFDLMGGCC